MSEAVFVAADPHGRRNTEDRLQAILEEMRGVTDWNVEGGQVTVEYDGQETSSNVIEEALSGIGFRIKHVQDTEKLGHADTPNLGVRQAPTRGPKYGAKRQSPPRKAVRKAARKKR